MWWREVADLAVAPYFDDDLHVWRLPNALSIQITVGRPLKPGEQADEGWAEELYEVTDPEHAFVAEIAIGR